jgi:dihydrofolate synthase / folylpolyglutamate synthase
VTTDRPRQVANEEEMTPDTPETRTPDSLLDSLSQPTRLGTRPGLERVRALLAALGNPERGLPVVHVGGTSGKGSTATIIAAILRAAGYRVGLHAKPHLRSVEERIVVDGQPISSADLVSLLDEIAPVAREVRPSWHELTTALMLAHFRRRAVDVAVVEVGLGGTFDSTNVVEPLVAVLSNVGLDHTEVLGDTVEAIASDKVGIFKAGARIVAGVKQPSVIEIVRASAAAIGAPLALLGEEIRIGDSILFPADEAYPPLPTSPPPGGGEERRPRTPDAPPPFEVRGGGGVRSEPAFDLRVGGRSLPDLHLGLIGRHQVENAALAVAAALALEKRGFVVPDSAIREALANVRLPGRIEIVRAAPTVLIDGAHNPDKMAALAAALRASFRWRKLIGVLAFKRGHDHRATLAAIAPLLDEVWLTRFAATTDFGRDASQDLDTLAGHWGDLRSVATLGSPLPPREADASATLASPLPPRERGVGGDGCVPHLEPDPFAAIRAALASAAPDDLVIVTGSLYLVGQLRDWLLAGA